ncbi:MAG: ComEC family competence protein [Chlorobiaceae bacterium]|nr:ComEC family competence protein [Chlorobiaceae bacterium]
MKTKNIQNNDLLRTKNIGRQAITFSLAPYPAVRLLFCITAGILLGVFVRLDLEIWLVVCAISLLLLIVCTVFEKLKHTGTFPLPFTVFIYTLFVVISFAAFADYRLNYASLNGLIPYTGKDLLLYGRVESRPDFSEKGTGFMMETEEVFENGKTVKVHDRAKVFIRRVSDSRLQLQQGDMIRVKGKLDYLPEAANRGEFSPRQAARMKQISVQLYTAGPWQVQKEGESRPGLFERYIVNPVYRYITRTLEQLMPDGEERKLATGVLTGEKQYLPEEVFETFKVTGTAHILAVSGFNVGLLVLVVHVLLQRLKVTTTGRWTAFLLVLFILLVYCYVTGNSPSVKRAAIMTAVLLAGQTLGRKSYPLNSLALSDIIILFLDPLDLLNPGFLMTNGAVLGILLLYPRFNARKPEKKGIIRAVWYFLSGSFLVTLAAIIGVSPVIACYFGTFSLVSLLANIPVVLFSTILMYGLVPMLLLNLVSAYVASIFAESALFFATLTLKSADFFSRFPWATISLKPDLTEVLLYYASLGAVIYCAYLKAWGKVAVSLLLGSNLLFWYSFFLHVPPDAPSLVTVNLGRNIAALVTAGNRTLQIDAGSAAKDNKRIARQFEEYNLAAPEAAVQFFSPDSLISLVPARYRMLRADSLLVLPSMVVMRPGEKVLKIWTRNRSLLFVSGTSRLKEEERFKADIVFLWIYRFTAKQREEISSWLNYARPERCIFIPGSFLSRNHLALLHSFAAGNPALEVRSKTLQIVLWERR